ncbi:MAG: hypothetical protein O7E52_06715 [Candidatus Poribacteria bacterium]|nr:hypothetical protein [Candidatus Poribacteria bacterium]
MYRLKRFEAGFLLLIYMSLAGCTSLSTQWSENFALTTYGTKANHPALNDGNLETIAAVVPRNERIFTLKFPEAKSVRKIVIHNGNLFRFKVDYWDNDAFAWKTIYSVRQRRDIGAHRAQATYVLDRLNFKTSMLRINVSRTVDDDVIPKLVREPGDRVLTRRMDVNGVYYYRVMNPAWAQIREIEVYQLAKK